MMKIETRFASEYEKAAELRFDEAGSKFVGVIPFGSLSVDLGGFRERIAPSAFRSTLAAGADVRALVNHDSAQLLGRTSNRTLRLTESAAGLHVEVDLPDTSYANDVRTLVKRGDIRGLSFGFFVNKGGQKFTNEGGGVIRELLDCRLTECSIVSNPAYPEANVSLRVDPAVLQQVAAENLSPRRSRCAALLRMRLAESA